MNELKDLILEALKSVRLSKQVDEGGHGADLIDVLTPPWEETVAAGIEEREWIADHLALALDEAWSIRQPFCLWCTDPGTGTPHGCHAFHKGEIKFPRDCASCEHFNRDFTTHGQPTVSIEDLRGVVEEVKDWKEFATNPGFSRGAIDEARANGRIEAYDQAIKQLEKLLP